MLSGEVDGDGDDDDDDDDSEGLLRGVHYLSSRLSLKQAHEVDAVTDPT